jgi:probable rRNA maturation factor
MKMNSNIYLHSECDFEARSVSNLEPWIKTVITKENKTLGEINYIFCTDEYLLEKNQTFLNHNTYTDIITFDYSEENQISGDIFISIERVKENARKFAVEFETELKRVMIHGVLHLIGYKDKSEDEQKLMREKENFYLEEIS